MKAEQMTNKNQIIEIIQKAEYENYGIRVMMRNPITGKYPSVEIGGSIENSYHWEDGETMGEEIEGVCAVEITIDSIDDALHILNDYIFMIGNESSCKNIVLMGSEYSEGGNDYNEIIMEEPEILVIW